MIGISTLYTGLAGANDRLRYRKAGTRGSKPADSHRPVVVWNVTQRCNLRCVHCYAAATPDAGSGDLSSPEARRMLEDLAAFGCPVVLFSGGEPLIREDVPELMQYALQLGLRTAVSTNGTLIDDRLAERLANAGLSYAGISLDGMEAVNDRFRAKPGAFRAAMAGIRAARRAGVRVGLRITLTRWNVGDVPQILNLLEEESIDRVCFYHLVYTGRGNELRGDDLSHADTRAVVDRIIDAAADFVDRGRPKEVLTVDNHCDGPYLYLRMVREGHPRAEEAMALLRSNGGNGSGSAIGCVSWDGTAYPDQFWRTRPLGNVRERPFSDIWLDPSNRLLQMLREKHRHLRGRCAACRFLDVCGGNLRARAESVDGDPWACDPACYLTDEEIGL